MWNYKQMLLAVILGFFLDLCFGDPRWLYHPVRLIGSLITWLEKRIRGSREQSNQKEVIGGGILVLFVVTITTSLSFLLLFLAGWVHPIVRVILESFMCYQMFAMKSLRVESMKVYKKLKEDDLEGSRYAVSMIVGRDTKKLTKEGVAKAAIETVAENTSDGVIAPMFYMLLGGAVGAYFYKAINTMDSMIGYKSDKYLYFGRIAAKLDDIVNFIPARVSGVLMIGASFLLQMDTKQAIRIFRRDRFRHASPNSAQTEAVCAGALRIQLAGDAIYFGKLYKKETIGDKLQEATAEDIKRANQLLYGTAFLGIFLVTLCFLIL